MRIFGSERLDKVLSSLGMKEGEAIVHPWVNKSLEKAQAKVEGRNFDIRKQLLKFDDVMNDQRKVVYEQRKELMQEDDVHEAILDMRAEVTDGIVAKSIPEKAYAEQWDVDTLHEEVLRVFGLDLPVRDWAKEDGIADQEIKERITAAAEERMADKEETYGSELMRMAEKSLLLQLLDQHWKEHLLALDHLRQGISLRAYGQRDPLNEYKREAFTMFEEMLARLREMITGVLAHLEIRTETEQAIPEPQRPRQMQETRQDPALVGAGAPLPDQGPPPAPAVQHAPLRTAQPAGALNAEDPASWGKVPRNASCPCGSGKKFKHCHGRVV